MKYWRTFLKQKIIACMGGSCVCCGYSKSAWGLVMHHVDPSQKDFNFSKVRASPESWSSIIEELQKCVLVCQNCHAEIHNGISVLPETYPTFDVLNEDMLSYENFLKSSGQGTTIDCPVCGKIISHMRQNCSKACASKRRLRIDWSELPDLLNDFSHSEIAVKLGCSEPAVYKQVAKMKNGSIV